MITIDVKIDNITSIVGFVCGCHLEAKLKKGNDVSSTLSKGKHISSLLTDFSDP